MIDVTDLKIHYAIEMAILDSAEASVNRKKALGIYVAEDKLAARICPSVDTLYDAGERHGAKRCAGWTLPKLHEALVCLRKIDNEEEAPEIKSLIAKIELLFQ